MNIQIKVFPIIRIERFLKHKTKKKKMKSNQNIIINNKNIQRVVIKLNVFFLLIIDFVRGSIN